MKKILKIFILLIVIIAVILLAFSCRNGFGLGIGIGIGNEKGKVSENKSKSDMDKKLDDQVSRIDGESDIITVKISVSGNDYYYEGENLALEDLFERLNSIKEKYLVEVTDDNASLKAYNKLIEQLKKRNVLYTENE